MPPRVQLQDKEPSVEIIYGQKVVLDGAELPSTDSVMAQLPAWIADSNGVAPHSQLGYNRAQRLASRSYAEQC